MSVVIAMPCGANAAPSAPSAARRHGCFSAGIPRAVRVRPPEKARHDQDAGLTAGIPAGQVAGGRGGSALEADIAGRRACWVYSQQAARLPR